MEKPESVRLFFKEGSSDKEYNAYLEKESMGWKVRFSYGRRGNAGNSGSKTPFPIEYDKAKKIYDKLVYGKMAKGYTEDKQGIPFLSADEDKRPTGWIPQLLNPIDEEEVQKYIDSDGWCMQEKIDGHNRLLIKEGDVITGTNRKGLVVPIPKEVEDQMRSLPIENCVIAGEATDQNVFCFDLISMKAGYEERYQAMVKLMGNQSNLLTVWAHREKRDKQRAFNKLKKEKAEGVVFKQKDAHYTPGRPESGGSQLKFKFYATASVIAGPVNEGKRSVSMFVLDGGVKVDVGNVTIYPNQEVPKLGTILEVRYLYAYKDGSLYQPKYLFERDDIETAACVIGQLKYKQETT